MSTNRSPPQGGLDLSRSAFALHSEDEDDDDISINPTPREDDEKEYRVEGVRAEGRKHGRKFFLIEWETFPFHECTWEPEGGLNQPLREEWDRTKAAIQAGLQPPFETEVQRFKDARAVARRARDLKRRKRDAKRLKKGLSPAVYSPDPSDPETGAPDSPDSEHGSPEDSQDADFESDSEQEASEGDEIDDGAARSRKAPTPPRSRQTIFKGKPDRLPEAGPSRRNSSVATTSKTGSSRITGARPSTDGRSATGYQGTARRASADKASTASASKPGTSGLASKITASRRSPPPPQARGAAETLLPRAPVPANPPEKSKMARKMVKSRAQPVVVGNVFAGGTKRKPRNNLGIRMADETSKPKLFRNRSLRRKAELKGRDRENTAIPVSELADDMLIDLSKHPKSPRSGKAPESAQEERPAEGPSAGTTRAPSAPASPSTVAPAPAPEAEEGPKKKKRKSVRFVTSESPEPTAAAGPITGLGITNVYDEPEAMDIDGSEPVQAQTTTRAPMPPPRKLSIAEYQMARLGIQNVNKTVAFGVSEARQSLEVSFSGIPRNIDHPWLNVFMSEATLQFGHVCLAETFVDMVEQFRPPNGNICAGTVSSGRAEDEQPLAAVAQYLKSTASGLFFSSQMFNIILYPAGCDEWKSDKLGVDTSMTPTSPAGGAPPLKHLFFVATLDISLFLNWNPLPPAAFGPGKADLPDRVQLMESVFGLGMSAYRRLIPPIAPRPGQPEVKHRFFLLFPQSTGETVLQVSLWLRACNPESEIYVHLQSGSWMAFLVQATAKKHDAAVFIIHESAIWTLRRIPRLLDFLVNTKEHVVWCWPDKSVNPPTLMPSIDLAPTVAGSPFDIKPVRLFPHGHCFLLTPSFLVADPMRALSLVKHLLGDFTTVADPKEPRPFWKKIVVASNIVDFLNELTLEKLAVRNGILSNGNRNAPGVHAREQKATAEGVSMEDCRCSFELASLLHEKIGPRYEDYHQQEYVDAVLFAPEDIDPSDEQSLVNWFGWWSLTRADQYRKFHVVMSSGSSPSPSWSSSDNLRARRSKLRIPNYIADATNDPDALLIAQEREAERRRLQIAAQQEQQQQQRQQQQQQEAQNAPPRPADAPSPAAAHDELPYFDSEILSSDHSRNVNGYLMDLQSKQNRPGLYRLWGFPVLWKDAAEAVSQAVLNPEPNELRNWFKYTRAFTDRRNAIKYVLYLGFFYTIDDRWHGRRGSGNAARPARRPWVLAWRSKTAEATDLVILDPDFIHGSAEQMDEASLQSAQRAAVEYVRDHDQEKVGQKQRLSTVWIGNFPTYITGTPFDKCLRFIDRNIGDLDIVPLHDDDLARQGYVKVVRPTSTTSTTSTLAPTAPTTAAAAAGSSSANSGDDSESMDLDNKPSRPTAAWEQGAAATAEAANDGGGGANANANANEGGDGDACKKVVIFHPPRGSQPLGTTKSRCTNHLFEAARLVRVRDGRAQTMEYEYRPTMEWYEEQVAEGRGFEHVHFGGWEDIARAAGVGQGGESRRGSY